MVLTPLSAHSAVARPALVRSASVAASASIHSTSPLMLDDGPFSVAPMMDYTDRFLRFLLRRISKRATLYTEMVTANTLVHADPNELERFLGRDDGETPVVLQLGGSDPEQLRRAAAIAAPWGFDAINLNCGCPSDRVAGRGCFGAALMRERALVAECCAAIADGAGPGVPVSVKCRIGVAGDVEAALRPDDDEAYASLSAFVDAVAAGSGVRHFVVHARKAVLGGLSPEQNRKVPPLKPELVRRLAAEHAGLRFSLNGGLQTVGDCDLALRDGDLAGVMVGRAVVARPWHWATVDTALYGAASDAATSRRQVLEEYAAFANAEEARLKQRVRRVLLSPALNLFTGEPFGKKYRAALDGFTKDDAETPIGDLLLRAADATLRADTLDAPPGVVYDQYTKEYVPADELARAHAARAEARAAAPAQVALA